MIPLFALSGALLSLGAALNDPLFAAPAPVNPRVAYAKELAAQERRRVESLLRVEKSSAARGALERAAARARSWETALAEAATSVGPQDGDLVVAGIRGSARLLREGRTLALVRGQLLREADEIATEEGRVELRFHDGTSITLFPGSLLRVQQAPRSSPPRSSFALERGELWWECLSTAPGWARVLTPRSLAQLKNGRAALAVDEAGRLRLAVEEGAVELAARPAPAEQTPRGPWEDIYN